ncbi:hypothetical protein EUTSA_v10002846mg [Eutrema salsugineum]|uniref:Transposase MuDR plant domain-containing protein n=1 Tax=Eutrema salsugineum TaxID=72664 RepID=V4L0A8_EUTSA|nr:hypothetical protein EUTSA_v10002846mg [Eutrema salsugineum]
MVPDSPPMHITNDIQDQSLIDNDHVGGRDGGPDEDADNDGNETAEECEDEDADRGADEINDEIKVEQIKIERVSGLMMMFWFLNKEYEKTWIEKIKVNTSFAGKDELISEIRLMALMLKFTFRADKSSKRLFVAKCVVKGCQWRVRAAIKNEAKTFWVTKYVKTHTCYVSDRLAHRKLTNPRYIGNLFIERVTIINGITVQHIKDSMRVIFGLKLDYTTSYRALMYALECVRRTTEYGYGNLPSYLHQIAEASPGTVTALDLDALIAGFQYLRRVIVVDGCHLTGKYEGVMLVATAQDGNFQIFLLAIGIVDSENDRITGWRFNVQRGSQDCVDLEHRKCAYGVYDIEKVPCSHIIAVSEAVHMHLATLVCPTYSKYYLYAAYWHNIYLAGSAIKIAKAVQFLPPEVRRKSRW